jgi:response regulator RpfG family c-di-GMP phosphodiesterase
MPIERFVLIDDSPDDNWFNQRALKQAGFKGEVITFDWAPEALLWLLEDQIRVPTCVLLDLNMPMLSGPDLVAELSKALTPRRRLQILLAISSEEPNRHEIVHVSPLISGYYRKPIQIEEVARLLQSNAPAL